MQEEQVVIVKLGALGDIIRTSYFLPAVRRDYPDAEIAWVVGEAGVDLLRFNPFVDRILMWPAASAVGHELRRVSRIYSLEEDQDILSWVASLGCSDVVGLHLANGEISYTHDVAEWYDMSLVSRFGREEADRRKLSNQASHGQIFSTAFKAPPVRYLPQGPGRSTALGDGVVQGHEPTELLIGVNSGAGARWPSKALPIDETLRLIDALRNVRLLGKPTRVALLGGPEEVARHAEIVSALPPGSVLDLGNDNPLLDFAAKVRKMAYLITSDSLALHCAISQGIRNLAFFGPTSAVEIDGFGLTRKVREMSQAYCTYSPHAEMGTLTGRRLFEEAVDHWTALGWHPTIENKR